MARRDSAASRSSSSSRGAPSGGRAARGRTDGKVDVSCPQCGLGYRIAAENLDQKIECQDCHRVFFAKTTVGKRTKAPDHTKVYVGFGIGAVALIVIFMAMSGGEKPKPVEQVYKPQPVGFSLGSHPRALELVKWARAIGDNNELVMSSHSDLPALAKIVEAKASDEATVMAALQSSEASRYFRELSCDSGALASEADMDSASGKATVYLTPKAGDERYLRNTRGEFELTFRMDGNQIKVTGWEMKMRPNRDPKHLEPSKGAINVNKDIARPDEATITDSAGTRKVQESKPAPVPHWSKSTPAQQAMADKVVADILASAEPEADNPGRLFNRATMTPISMEDKQAAVPRILNAMNDCYADVMLNNLKLSQLNRAMVIITGYSVNYRVEDSSTPSKDKTERESCVRQWFAFWWRYHEDLSKWFDTSENLDAQPAEPAKDPAKDPAKKPAK